MVYAYFMATTPRKSFIYSAGFGARTIVHFITACGPIVATLLMLKNEFVIRKTRGSKGYIFWKCLTETWHSGILLVGDVVT